jgi:SAM-dependent methyltransferase
VRCGVRGSRLAMYRELAQYYDLIYSSKDYRKESARLEAIARRYGRGGRSSWLDVACGTGRHLEFLRRRHTAAGIDLSPEMLRLARRRLPGVPLVRGDMRSFRLHRQFDVVTCLFSAIGHLPSKEDVRVAFENFARHLNPRGVAIVEPWIEPSAYRAGSIHPRTVEGSNVTIVRWASSSRRGSHSIITYHYLVGARGRGIQHWLETDEGLMLSRAELTRLMESAGLRTRFLVHGLWADRGLLVGIKSEPADLQRPSARSGVPAGRRARRAHRGSRPPVGRP